MYNSISLFISLRYFWNFKLPIFKKIITLISIISISISTASLIIIISIINGSENNFKKNILSFIPHLIITNKNKYINKINFPKNILQLNNIEKFSDFVQKEAIIQNQSNISIVEIIGIDVFNVKNIDSDYNKKNILDALPSGKYNVILGSELAKKINVNVGDTVKFIIFSDKNNIFLKEKFKTCICRVISTFSTKNEIDNYQVLINKQDALNLFDYSKNYITGWRVWFKNPLNFDLNEIKKNIHNLILLDWKSQKGELFKAIKIEKNIMLLLFFLIFFISILNVFITFTVYTLEKRKDIAILQTQGMLNWKIILIFVIIGSSIVFLGNILGTIISVILIKQNTFLKFWINIFFHEQDISIIIKPFQIVLINVISILFTIILILYPASNTVRIKPSRILSK